jgi:hypothetical protein
MLPPIRFTSNPALPLCFGLFAGQAVQAAQLTFEDFFMADLAMAPLKIVGFEGVFGSIMMIFVLLPAAYFLPGPEGLGLHENTLDTLEMIKNTRGLQVRFATAAAATVVAAAVVCLGRPSVCVAECASIGCFA